MSCPAKCYHYRSDMTERGHYPVLLRESVDALITDSSGDYIDATFGRGGHSRLILDHLNEQASLAAFDKDPDAMKEAQKIADHDNRFHAFHGSFTKMGELIETEKLPQADGILFDLGVSSPQLDQAERGFSFRYDGPLDMRMNNDSGQTAADWVNTTSQEAMTEAFKTYGEERFAKRIATAICERREHEHFKTTSVLADVVARANPKWEREKHPATRVFQAIRIAVNHELSDLETVLPIALDNLKIGGRLVVISFHSLEDRIVKRFFKAQARGKQYPKRLPIPDLALNQRLRLIGSKARASARELSENNRSRSAVMRVAEKIA